MAILRNLSAALSQDTDVSDYDNDTEVTTSWINCPDCLHNRTLEGSTDERDVSSPDAFMYIIVVLSFYVFAMTVLMVKYIRRENREAQLSYYFQEFINRDKFNTPQYHNKQRVNAIKSTLSRFYQSMRFSDNEKASALALQEVMSDGGSKSGSSVYVCSDSGVVSDHVGMEEADSFHEFSDIEKCHSDDELLAQEGATDRPPGGITVESDTETRLLPQLRLQESSV